MEWKIATWNLEIFGQLVSSDELFWALLLVSQNFFLGNQYSTLHAMDCYVNSLYFYLFMFFPYLTEV